MRIITLLVFVLCSSLFAQGTDELKPVIDKLNSSTLYDRAMSEDALNNTKDFIVKKLKETAAEPFDGDFANSFTAKSGLSVGENSVTFNVIVPRRGIPMDRIKPLKQTWQKGSDWLPLGFSAGGSIEEASIAFAGYGITTPGYDDYSVVNAKDKVVVVLADSPEGASSEKFKPQMSYAYKAKNAKEHGAKAVLFVKAMGDSANVFEPIVVDKFDSGIIALQVNRNSIEKYFARKKPLIDLERSIRKNSEPKSYLLPRVTANITLQLEEQEKEFTNIKAVIEGDDDDKNIIIAFPYDEALSNDKIEEYVKKENIFYYPSGNNISGITAALVLARRFTEEEPAVNIIFAALSGEEPGMNGSKEFISENEDLAATASAVFYLNNTDKVHKRHIEIYSDDPLIINTVRETEEFESLNSEAMELDIKDTTPLKEANGKYVNFSNKKRSYPPPKKEWTASDMEDLLEYINMLENTIRIIAEN